MKILLANTPYVKEEGKYGVKAGARWAAVRSRVRGMQYYPFPFFLAYATSVLKKEGFIASIRDFIAEETSYISSLSQIINYKPEVLVLETSTPSIHSDLQVLSSVKKESNLTTILVGPHASALPEELINNDYVDYIIPNEYEYTLRDFITAISKDHNPSSVKGLYYLSNGNMTYTGKRDLIDDLDELPYPERNDVPLFKYTDPSCKKFPNISILASRGCSKKCIFCLEPYLFYGKPNFRRRNPTKIVEEMHYLIDKYNPAEIYFDDSSFTLSNKFAKDVSEEIIKQGLKITWSCMADVDVDIDTLKTMKASGCQGLKFGVESADPEILAASDKKINIDMVREFVSNCKKLKLYTHGTFMFGLPGETRETIQKTIDFAFSLDITSSQFSVATPYPGTEFYEMAKKNGWLTTDDFRFFEGSCSPVISYPQCSPDDIIEGINRASRMKIRNLLLNPKVFIIYLMKLYKIHGPYHILSELFSKLMFIMKLKKA